MTPEELIKMLGEYDDAEGAVKKLRKQILKLIRRPNREKVDVALDDIQWSYTLSRCTNDTELAVADEYLEHINELLISFSIDEVKMRRLLKKFWYNFRLYCDYDSIIFFDIYELPEFKSKGLDKILENYHSAKEKLQQA